MNAIESVRKLYHRGKTMGVRITHVTVNEDDFGEIVQSETHERIRTFDSHMGRTQMRMGDGAIVQVIKSKREDQS